jgi:hypothetical protein
VALVKVLNPAFHGETTQKQITNKKPLTNSNTTNQQYQSTPIKHIDANESNKKQTSTSQSAININKVDMNNAYSSVKQKQTGNLFLTPGFEKGLNKGPFNKFQIEKPRDNFKVNMS